MKGKSGTANRTARERLLIGAAELFTRKGYAATTVREIVAQAKVTKPVLYYYFRNKEGIYRELMGESFALLDGLLETSRGAPGTAGEKLIRLCDQVFSLFLEHIKVVRVMYSIYYGPHQGAPFFDFDAYHLKFQQSIRRLVNEGIRRGEFRRGNGGDMTWAVIGAVNVAMEVELGHPEMRIGREGLARVLRLIFRGMSPEKGRTKGERE